MCLNLLKFVGHRRWDHKKLTEKYIKENWEDTRNQGQFLTMQGWNLFTTLFWIILNLKVEPKGWPETSDNKGENLEPEGEGLTSTFPNWNDLISLAVVKYKICFKTIRGISWERRRYLNSHVETLKGITSRKEVSHQGVPFGLTLFAGNLFQR